MKVKDIIMFSFIAILIIGIAYLLYKVNHLQSKIIDIKVQESEIRQKNILLFDSLQTIKYKQYQRTLDSSVKVLSKKDSLLDVKNKRQDERLRNLYIPSSELPNF